MPSDWLARVAYVGNKGTHLQTFRERNAAVYSPADRRQHECAAAVAPYYASMKELADAGNSTYHALQVTLDKRLREFLGARFLHVLEVHR